MACLLILKLLNPCCIVHHSGCPPGSWIAACPQVTVMDKAQEAEGKMLPLEIFFEIIYFKKIGMQIAHHPGVPGDDSPHERSMYCSN